MGLKRYVADSDNTIVSAYQSNLSTRGTGSNAGAADVVEVYSVYGRQQASSSTNQASQELSRVLMKFPVSKITTDRNSGAIPQSGSVSFYLRVFNAEHSKTVPDNFSLIVHPLSRSWQEGDGLDLENYKDLTKGNRGSNWLSASNTQAWTTVGGDYLTSSVQWDASGEPPLFKQDFESGLEDIMIDISPLVENWLADDLGNYGVGIMLSSSYEAYYSASNDYKASPMHTGSILNNTGGAQKSYYTKRFFARGTQYFFKRPVIEARWDSSRRDDRGEFYYSSSLAPAADNLNTLYLYNYVRGRLRNIPAIGTTGSIMVSLYSGSSDNTAPSGSKLQLYNAATAITGGYVATGIYSASVGLTASTTPITTLYDVWWSGSGEDPATGVTEFFTSSISPAVLQAQVNTREPIYYINITNLRNTYDPNETARFNLYVREKNWSPTIYSVANENIENLSIVSASYRIYRTLDAYEAISYGTGSDFHTGLSYDVSGNYFDFDMKLLEPGYTYAFKFAFYDDELSTWSEQDESFKFRVRNYEY